MTDDFRSARRRFLTATSALACAAAGAPVRASTAAARLERPIPSTGEKVPAIGLGTWITFDAGYQPGARDPLLPVMRGFLASGGTLVDSSPMYGSAEAVVGDLWSQLRRPPMFSATKIWTLGRGAGMAQVERSMKLWGVERLDLVQVHNLLDWRTHLATLEAMKREGRIRYVGVTTSHGSRHDELERIMRERRLDFVQFTYSVADRDADARLLPLARDRGIAVIANRPFDGGHLFTRVRGKPLPGWAREIDCANWAQAFLKFIVAHPAVTCAIPATSDPAHLAENMGALAGALPDAGLRARIVRDTA
jgi:diketogulonate reductase-like aldo/keto reductase